MGSTKDLYNLRTLSSVGEVRAQAKLGESFSAKSYLGQMWGRPWLPVGPSFYPAVWWGHQQNRLRRSQEANMFVREGKSVGTFIYQFWVARTGQWTISAYLTVSVFLFRSTIRMTRGHGMVTLQCVWKTRIISWVRFWWPSRSLAKDHGNDGCVCWG